MNTPRRANSLESSRRARTYEEAFGADEEMTCIRSNSVGQCHNVVDICLPPPGYGETRGVQIVDDIGCNDQEMYSFDEPCPVSIPTAQMVSPLDDIMRIDGSLVGTSAPSMVAPMPIAGQPMNQQPFEQPMGQQSFEQPMGQQPMGQQSFEQPMGQQPMGQPLDQPLGQPVGQAVYCESDKEKCIYIDRISPILSDSRIIAAIANELAPMGVPKVQSLEVIRTQKSRHVHAFAILNMKYDLRAPIEVPVAGGEYIKVQSATKQLQIPPPPMPCRTLHIRIYAMRTQPWAAAISRMTWGGMMSLLETVSPGICSNISMVADDQSPRSNVSHSTVLLSVFFCECPSVEHAMRVRQAVHDQSTRGLDDTLFLLRADYAKGEKKLHDTSDNQASLHTRFQEAREFALAVGAGKESAWKFCDGNNCGIPADCRHHHRVGLCNSFVFSEKKAEKKKPDSRASNSHTKQPHTHHAAGGRNFHKVRRITGLSPHTHYGARDHHHQHQQQQQQQQQLTMAVPLSNISSNWSY